MQDIQAVLNILDPRQTTTLWPDTQQTTLKANETLYFTTVSIKLRNFLPAGEQAALHRVSKFFTSADSSLYSI